MINIVLTGGYFVYECWIRWDLIQHFLVKEVIMDNQLLKGNVFKTLMIFAIPYMLSNLLQVLYGSADLLVVGQFGQTFDISGVSIGS